MTGEQILSAIIFVGSVIVTLYVLRQMTRR